MTEEEKSSLRRQAEECLKAGLYDKAITIYRRLADANPEEESLLLALAWACYDGGRREEAVDCFELLFRRELARRVFTGFAYDELVRIYRDERRYDRLVNLCERAASAQPQDAMLLVELGAAYLKAGRAGEAIGVLKKIADLEPDEASVHCLLAEAHIAAGDFDDAEAACARAVAGEAEAASSFYSRLAHCYLKTGEPARAEALFRKCLDKEKGNPLYHCSLGDALIVQGKLNEAEAAYKKAASLKPASAAAFYHRLGNALASAGYRREAAESCDKASKMDERNG